MNICDGCGAPTGHDTGCMVDIAARRAVEVMELRSLVDLLLGELRSRHPRPWRVEEDWTFEVLDAGGRCVTKCQTYGKASGLVAAAHAADMHDGEMLPEYLRLLAEHGIDDGGDKEG